MRWNALDAVGLYVPGGKAAYPSSVLMNAIPARVAGVARRRDVRARRRTASLNPLVLAAARRAGVTRSTASAARRRWRRWPMAPRRIAPVDRIVGPGNAYVAEAKRQVFGRVGIDSIAGPSEVVDRSPMPPTTRVSVAVDLLAQAEHDEAAQAILITDDAGFADAVARGGGGRAAHPAPRGHRRRPPGATMARSSWCATGTRRRRWSTASRRNICRS